MNGSDVNRVVGADIGGANLKYASDRGRAVSRCFALWQQAQLLADAISKDLAQFSATDTLAVTMTGELADCYVDRRDGVRSIVDACEQAAQSSGIRRVRFYGTDGRFYDAADAKDQVDLIAAANWHALASHVARDVISDGLLVDVGSTTTDVIAIGGGQLLTAARSDHERLMEGSLVYVGCRRTPVCALVDRLNFDGRDIPIMNEVFATIDDARIMLSAEPESPTDLDSADGRPRTREFAANRLARMIGLDRRQVSREQAGRLASQVRDAAVHRIGQAIHRFLAAGSPVVLSGHGQDLVSLPSAADVRHLSDQLGPEISRCAPAYAVACLCQADLLHKQIPEARA